MDELNFEFNALDNKLNKIESHYDKIKRIFNDLSELNSQSLESNKDRLTRVYQIQTEKYYNKDTVKKELEYHITSLNKELTK